jgi:putative hydrolase of the HAD superfamily
VGIRALFWDVDGVLLTGGWGRSTRRRVLPEFGLDPDAFQARHDEVKHAFKTGRLTLEAYLDHTVFDTPRSFSREDFAAAMHAQSALRADEHALATKVAATGRYLMATLNNAPRELHIARVARFALADVFDVFLASCFLGATKPEPAFFEAALALTGRAPHECVVIDDRPAHVESARALGFVAVQHESAEALAATLRELGCLP